MAEAKRKAWINPNVKCRARRDAGIENPSTRVEREPWYRLPEFSDHELALARLSWNQRDALGWLAACNLYASLLPDEARERAEAALLRVADELDPLRRPVRSIGVAIPGLTAAEVHNLASRKGKHRRAAGEE